MIRDFWTRHRFVLPVLCLESSFPGGSLFSVKRMPRAASPQRQPSISEFNSTTKIRFGQENGNNFDDLSPIESPWDSKTTWVQDPPAYVVVRTTSGWCSSPIPVACIPPHLVQGRFSLPQSSTATSIMQAMVPLAEERSKTKNTIETFCSMIDGNDLASTMASSAIFSSMICGALCQAMRYLGVMPSTLWANGPWTHPGTPDEQPYMAELVRGPPLITTDLGDLVATAAVRLYGLELPQSFVASLNWQNRVMGPLNHGCFDCFPLACPVLASFSTSFSTYVFPFQILCLNGTRFLPNWHKFLWLIAATYMHGQKYGWAPCPSFGSVRNKGLNKAVLRETRLNSPNQMNPHWQISRLFSR